MKRSTKQQVEFAILMWWIPENYEYRPITDKDVDDFFAWSDRGVPHGRNILSDHDGFCALYWAKNRRDLQITTYLEDWNYIIGVWDFDEEPPYIVKDIAKRLKKPVLLQCYRGGAYAEKQKTLINQGVTSWVSY
jgi:hypothetical protein